MPIRKLYLYGAATQMELVNFIRTEATEGEVERLPQTVADWRVARAAFAQVIAGQPDEAERLGWSPLVGSALVKAEEYLTDPRASNAFGLSQFEYRTVEIDRLVAPQREINLDYVDTLISRWGSLSEDDVLRICLEPAGVAPVTPPLQLAANVYSYSTSNPDFRFLGGFAKPLTSDDLPYLTGGGQPTAALILFVGLGANPVNVWVSGSRHVLNNGFHRIFALRRAGVTRVPVLAQISTDANLDFPSVIAGLPREYLLGQRRPVLIKDFYNDAIIRVIQTKARTRTVRLGWNADQAFVPADDDS